MPKIIKPFRIAIDIQTLFNKKITNDTESLRGISSQRGALGAVTLFSDVYDLYLISQYSGINNEEIIRWLKAGDIDRCFRYITENHENVRDFYLQNNIGITITSDANLAEELSQISTVYWLRDVHVAGIQEGIQKVISWKDIVRHITKHSSTENYDYRYNQE